MSKKIITLFAILFCLSININTSSAQIKKIYLEDVSASYGTQCYNLYQRYGMHKGKLIPNNYGFIGTDEISFGRNGDFPIDGPRVEVPFNRITTSLDNSTIIGSRKDTLYVYDIALGKIVNQFVFKNPKRIMTNNDGSMAIVELEGNLNKVIDTNTGKTLKEISFDIENFCFSANNRYLALNETEFIHVYDFWEGGEPFVYESRVVSKKKKSSSEYIWYVDITSDGLMSMSIALRGRVKKNFFRKQEYAVIDVKNGERVFELKLEEDDKEWYYYSLDPTGKVFYAKGKFYDIKTKKEIEVVRKGRNREGENFSSWKFHPHIQGVYHAENGEGVIGLYSFE